MESIHVPASTVQRIATVVKWIAPYVLAGMVTVIGMCSRWIVSRTSVVETSDALKIATIQSTAEAGQRLGTHCDDIIKIHDAQIRELSETIVLIWAETEVDRAYSRSPRRGEYIEAARKFYANEYEAQLRNYPTNPALALKLTRKSEWQPGIH